MSTATRREVDFEVVNAGKPVTVRFENSDGEIVEYKIVVAVIKVTEGVDKNAPDRYQVMFATNTHCEIVGAARHDS